jgi:hypothetical protein
MQKPPIILAYATLLAFVLSFNLAVAQEKDLQQLTDRFDKLLSGSS